MSLEYWFMLPISTVVATIAMASGVEGATFFTPIFILALGLPPEVAIGTGLITEVFGFASGVTAYLRKRLIDFRLAGAILIVSVPIAIIGSQFAKVIEPDILKTILGMALLAVAFNFLRSPDHTDVARLDDQIDDDTKKDATRCLTTADGETICYTVCNRGEGMLMGGIGGLFIGMISTGLGELNAFFFIQRCRVPSRVAVATSVFIVAVTALLAAGGHVVTFVQAGEETVRLVMSLVVFTIPGVIVGAQVGAAVGARLPQHTLIRSLGVLFLLVSLLMLGQVVLTARGA